MKDSQDLHEWVRDYNWDNGLAPIWPIVRNDTTELATALLIYWRLEGPWFHSETKANEEAAQLHALVESRLLQGVYARGSIRYHPIKENGLSKTQLAKLKQSGVPARLLEPDYGS